MAVLSGKYAIVDNMSTVSNWSVNETSTPARYRASNLQAGTGRKEGIYDYSGSFEGFGGVPPVMPGEYFDFDGFTAPTSGAFGTTGITKSVNNSIVDSVTINWNWLNGEILKWTVAFSAGEPLILSDATVIHTDASTIVAPIVCGTKATLTGGDTTWPNLESVMLTITADNVSYVNSSTSGKTGRRRGPIDWTAAVIEQSQTEFGSLIASSCLLSLVGGDNILKFWVDGTRFWHLQLAHLVDTSDLSVDLDSGEIIKQTHNFAMSADESGSVGFLARPGELVEANYWWPTTINATINPF